MNDEFMATKKLQEALKSDEYSVDDIVRICILSIAQNIAQITDLISLDCIRKDENEH